VQAFGGLAEVQAVGHRKKEFERTGIQFSHTEKVSRFWQFLRSGRLARLRSIETERRLP
jgi:hypothetical protein